MFQFIIYRFMWQIYLINSNTSHVPIYQGARKRGSKHIFSFKYISCSNLSLIPLSVSKIQVNSNTSHVPIYPVRKWKRELYQKNSNTSHVPIYQWMVNYPQRSLPNSNTSHVPIYLLGNQKNKNLARIQIHLMFQFITHSSQSFHSQ